MIDPSIITLFATKEELDEYKSQALGEGYSIAEEPARRNYRYPMAVRIEQRYNNMHICHAETYAKYDRITDEWELLRHWRDYHGRNSYTLSWYNDLGWFNDTFDSKVLEDLFDI